MKRILKDRGGCRLRRTVSAILLAASAAASAQSPLTTESILNELRENHAIEALRDAGTALRARPRETRLWILKGIAANQLNRPAVALDAFQAALRLEPTSLPALEGASEVAFRINSPAAHDLVARLLAQAPDNPQANGMAGMLDVDRSDWTAAAEHFAKAGPAITTQRVALEAHVAALDHLGRNAEAEAVVRHMLELWPDDANLRENLALLELRQKHPEAALATLEPLLASNNETALSLAATAYEALGDTPNAVAALRHAMQLKPKDPQNYLDFAAISFDHSSFPAGIAMLDAGLTQLPNSAALHIARGVLYMQNSEIKRAEQEFQTANHLDPAQSFGLEAQGLTEMQRHNLPEALSKVQASLKQSPNDAYLNYLAAEILKERGVPPNSPEAKEAIDYAERALTADPTLLPALDLLGSLQFEAGDFPAAAKSCRAALVRNPADQEALFRLVLTLRRTGDPQKEIAGQLEQLRHARSQEHREQVRVSKYHLSTESTPSPQSPDDASKPPANMP